MNTLLCVGREGNQWSYRDNSRSLNRLQKFAKTHTKEPMRPKWRGVEAGKRELEEGRKSTDRGNHGWGGGCSVCPPAPLYLWNNPCSELGFACVIEFRLLFVKGFRWAWPSGTGLHWHLCPASTPSWHSLQCYHGKMHQFKEAFGGRQWKWDALVRATVVLRGSNDLGAQWNPPQLITTNKPLQGKPGVIHRLKRMKWVWASGFSGSGSPGRSLPPVPPCSDHGLWSNHVNHYFGQVSAYSSEGKDLGSRVVLLSVFFLSVS